MTLTPTLSPIPARCVHCGAVLPGLWDTTLLWGRCADCATWQAYLWRQRRPVRVEETKEEPCTSSAI